MPRRFSVSGDRIFFLIVIILVVGGMAMFASASLGLLASEDGSPLKLAVTQLALGLIPGVIALTALRYAPPKWIMGAVLPAYVITLLFTLAVFIPGIGLHLNGATRWINLGFTTVQPGEFLKISVILMVAAYLSKVRGQISNIHKGLIPFATIIGIPIVVLLAQPNTSTVLIIGLTCSALYFLAGAPLRDFAIMGIAAVVVLGALVLTRPYLMDRVMTFVHPSANSHTSGYQIQQSLIAIGSGEWVGRGFGQSVQKFNYLPEAEGDSVFAVFGEEFGFLGSIILVLIFVAFAARGFSIAAEASSAFGSLTATGLTLMISLSAFLNMSAMLGIMPLTGLPLPFVSHGGTALFAALAAVGLILNVAANRAKRRG
jgi:cell division protein FtsW